MPWSSGAMLQLTWATRMGQSEKIVRRLAEEQAKRDDAPVVYRTHVLYVREGLK